MANAGFQANGNYNELWHFVALPTDLPGKLMGIRVAFIITCIVCLAFPVCAQQIASPTDPSVAPPAAVETDVAKHERELASRSVDVTKAEEAEAAQRLIVADIRTRIEKLNTEGEEEQRTKADEELRLADEALIRLTENTRAALELYDQAKAKLDIAKKNEELETKKSEKSANGSTAKTPIDDVFQKRSRVAQAAEEAELAQRKTLTLRQQLETLLNRQQEIRRASDRMSQQLSGSGEVTADERKRLWDERQQYVEAGRRVAEEIQLLREEILVAEATQRIKEESAQDEVSSFARWKTDLLTSGILFASVFLVLIGVRVIVARRIQEPSHRYFVNKILSLLTLVLLIAGLAFIFADQFSNLLTLFGLAVAGVTIALQEIVASFAAWFFIRSSRGYRAGDWVQLGDFFGEVIDIGFLRTTIKQHQVFSLDGRPDGGLPTGGLIVLMNNNAFKHPLVNYSREFPFIWCALRYNITFESNWERARELILEVLNSEPEIVDTARQAQNHFEEMSANFSIKVDSTEPVVRCWTSGVGVELTARFLAHPRRRPHLMDAINLKVLRQVTQSDDIRFAYWTIRSIPTPPTEKTLPQDEETSTTVTTSVGERMA